MQIGICMATGCEEIEALTVVDVLRRGKIRIDMISITGEKKVTGSHQITFETDALMEQVDWSAYDGIVLPGGMPGTKNLEANAHVQEVIRTFAKEGKLVAAICAAPMILGHAGLLEHKRATSYPGFEKELLQATVTTDPVVVDGNIITGRGMGTAIPFALEIVAYLTDDTKAKELAESIIFFGK